MKLINIIMVSTIILFFLSPILKAQPTRVPQVTYGFVNNCLTGYTEAVPVVGNGPRNLFGRLIVTQFLSTPGATGKVF